MERTEQKSIDIEEKYANDNVFKSMVDFYLASFKDPFAENLECKYDKIVITPNLRLTANIILTDLNGKDVQVSIDAYRGVKKDKDGNTVVFLDYGENDWLYKKVYVQESEKEVDDIYKKAMIKRSEAYNLYNIIKKENA